jgi:putative isomerase
LLNFIFSNAINPSRHRNRRRVVTAACPEPGFLSVGNDYSTCANAADCVGSFKGESGLDQSPKWDCLGARADGSGGDCDVLYRQGSYVLQLGDAQSTALFVADTAALLEIAGILMRKSEGSVLETRHAAVAPQLARMWDEGQEMFADVDVVSGAFSSRVSPTIFYPLMARMASVDQAGRLVARHLLNASEFCVSANYAQENSEDCYWGLPSIAKSDISYMKPLSYVYWRGLVWGPMTLLTYWSLDAYANASPLLDGARRALVTQVLELALLVFAPSSLPPFCLCLPPSFSSPPRSLKDARMHPAR